MESRVWKFTTMNMWPFQKTEFRAGFGECGDGGDECIWVSKRDGFYQRRVVRDEGGRKEFIDVLKSKWVWKW
ncbi:hypothetical protein F2Q70_00018640 [Brassica cretica]|uniref:S-protein homolog n=1 Tax=Brassica cretica TaxID=69181 RepID=A0A8S9HVE2_BRACR|nr:hypothetical protein F2Q70_00018640 [Brassica cretica]